MKRMKWLLVVLAVIIAAGSAVVWYITEHVFVDGTPYRRDSAVVDLRDKNITAEQYELLSGELPGAKILWNVPVQGTPYPLDAEEVRLISMSPEGPDSLKYLPNIRTIHAEECREYEAVTAFQLAHPEIHVVGNLALGDQAVACSAEEITLEADYLTELETLMPYLHNLKTVKLTGQLPAAHVLLALQERYPEITFSWNVNLGTQTLPNDAAQVTLKAGDSADTLTYLSHLEQVDLRSSGLTEQQMRNVADAMPEVVFVWDTTLYGKEVCTDAEELDLSRITIKDVPELERELSYFRKLKKVDMSYCGVSDEEMDALNRRHEDVRYVWTVSISIMRVRTDETTFMPWKAGIYIEARDIYPLRYCTDMIVVDVGHNWVTNCEWAAFMPNLQFLILGETGISDITPLTGLTNLKYLELFTVPVTDYWPLVTCTGLEDLNLGETYGDPTPIAQMTWLKNLCWCDVRNPLHTGAASAVDMLPEALPNTRCYFDGYHPGYGWWRFLDNYYEMRDLLNMPYLNQDGRFW